MTPKLPSDVRFRECDDTKPPRHQLAWDGQAGYCIDCRRFGRGDVVPSAEIAQAIGRRTQPTNPDTAKGAAIAWRLFTRALEGLSEKSPKRGGPHPPAHEIGVTREGTIYCIHCKAPGPRELVEIPPPKPPAPEPRPWSRPGPAAAPSRLASIDPRLAPPVRALPPGPPPPPRSVPLPIPLAEPRDLFADRKEETA